MNPDSPFLAPIPIIIPLSFMLAYGLTHLTDKYENKPTPPEILWPYRVASLWSLLWCIVPFLAWMARAPREVMHVVALASPLHNLLTIAVVLATLHILSFTFRLLRPALINDR